MKLYNKIFKDRKEWNVKKEGVGIEVVEGQLDIGVDIFVDFPPLHDRGILRRGP